MSSIAYITDPNMIEYHRLRGSKSMVFWRMGLKKFKRFDPGDLVFFIDRRHRHPDTQEKGVIGFGRCGSISNMPLNKAWTTYQQHLGYDNEHLFKESVRYFRKEDDTLPKRIQCIELTHVLFFKYPVFLSEVDFEVSERLESFTYIGTESQDLTLDVLNIAKKFGIDAWFSMQNKEANNDIFKYVENEYALRQELKELPKYVNQRSLNLMKKHTEGVFFEDLYYSFDGTNVTLNYFIENDLERLYSIYGVQEYLKKKLPNNSIKTQIFTRNPSQSILELIQELKLMHVSI